jgi:hypothetical protein
MQGSSSSILFQLALKVFKPALEDYPLPHSFHNVEEFNSIENY